MNSLERSLQIGLAGSLVILLFIFWWSVTLTSRMLTESHVFAELEQQAYDVNANIVRASGDISPYLEQLAALSPNRAYLLASNNALSVTPSGSAARTAVRQLEVPELVPGQSIRLSATLAKEQTVLAWFGGFHANEEQFVLGVVQDVTSVRDKLSVFQWFGAFLAFLLLGVLMAVQRFILRRSIDKLEGIRRDMLRLEHGQAVALSEDVPSEVMPLVIEFNQLLRRFEQRLRQSRNAVGNLAHSLKGPLNLLIRSSQSPVIDDSQRHTIAQNAEAIRRLIESELKRARLAGRGAVGMRFDIDAELPAMIGLLEQVYSEKTVKVSYHVGRDVELVHDRQDMLELIGNLLDNAVKWCATRVVLTLENGDGVHITVEDDGPGCSPEVLGRLTGRGVRLDESVAGHGLGLSIVKDIVDTYDGRLLLEPSQSMGGLKVSVYLPRRR